MEESTDKDDRLANHEEHAQYRSVAGITNHMVRWSRKDCQNVMREISQFLEAPTQKCLDAQKRLTNFIIATKDQGYTIKPYDPGGWDGKSNYVFTISGESDSEYAKDPS